MKRRWEYKKSSPSNLFGAFGYTLWLMACVLTFVVYVVWLAWDGTGVTLFVVDDSSVQPAAASAEPSLLNQLIGYGITAIMTTIALFIAITLPYWIGRWSSRLLKRGMSLLGIPERSLWLMWTKTGLVTLLVCLSGVASIWLFDGPLQDVALTSLFAMSLALVSLALFALQHYMAKVGRIDVAVLW